jgi:DNA-binding beta-propeller fold protein YncE
VAVDAAGNVYIADSGNNAIKEWSPSKPTEVTTLVSSGLYGPQGVAVDAAGNVYFADNGNNAIKEWKASTQQVTNPLVSSNLSGPLRVAVDAAGNVYFSTNNNALKELVQAYVPGGMVTERAAAGSDVLLPVLPRTQPLTGQFAPSSDQPWLTIKSTANGVIQFSFTANVGAARAADITLLGQKITVVQVAPSAINVLDESLAALLAVLKKP